MLFSSRSTVTIIYSIALASLALLATLPAAQADCFLQCGPIDTKVLFCGYMKSGNETMPTIGTDAGRDKCLCNQDNVHLYRQCLGCSHPTDVEKIAGQFVSDCKITDSSRNLVNGALSELSSLPNTATYAVVMVGSIIAAAAFSY
ncbi:hypothetical protein BC939DRAFT_503378 [Gamsiella multidivaricata]|uniref:uncharacterized protein n=1 Tax=Gamsiella multidivaricata TaxID=101098 RepID=UPI0022204C95|nr:uncharacterized protein BC939DRAFT_503378 [Gamsiella multidivaricata]KAI7823220.1 hypothetical protein BC939DRAFT_503378 [Gamsiella multidivaricata]